MSHPQFQNKHIEYPLAKHHGMFQRQLSLWEGVVLILSGTIGAGVLGIPFTVAKVGIGVGLAYILALGLLMIGLNLLIGDIASRTGKEMQLVGLAGEYLGPAGRWLMTGIMYSILFGVLVVYIIGQGEAFSVIFGGNSFWWSIGFFAVAGFLVVIGLKTIKTVELILVFAILLVVLLIAGFSAPHVTIDALRHVDLTDMLLPYGVILFAFHGATSIPETYSLLKHKEQTFKSAIILSGAIAIAVYMLFAFVVVGVTGVETTEIATIGLGKKVGDIMLILGNAFAILAMGTSFLMVGVSLKDSLRWDFKLSSSLASVIVLGVPLIIFLLGLRQFIAALDIVGGVFVSLELLLILLIYWKVKHVSRSNTRTLHLHHTALLGGILFIAFAVGGVYSVLKLL